VVFNCVTLKLSTDRLIELLNLLMSRLGRKRIFMTAAILLLETDNNCITLHNFGHPYPFLLAVDGTFSMIQANGKILGVREKPSSFPIQILLKPGERLYFYTDGLAESLSEDTFSGYEALHSFLASRPPARIEDMCRDILENHPHFKSGKPQPDDFTILLVERSIGESSLGFK